MALIVQMAKNAGTSCSFTNPTTPGNLLLASAGKGSDNAPFNWSGWTISDDGGNSWAVGSNSFGDFASSGTTYFSNGQVAYLPLSANAVNTITVSAADELFIYEVSGVGGFDVTALQQSTGGDNTASFTTRFNYDFTYIFTGVVASSATAPSGFTQLQSATGLTPPEPSGVTDFWNPNIGVAGAHTTDIGSNFAFQIVLTFQSTPAPVALFSGFIV